MDFSRFELVSDQYKGLVLYNILNKILNLIKAALLVYFLFDISLEDYSIAFLGAMFFVSIFSDSIIVALVPGIQRAETDKGVEGRMELTNKFANLSLLIALVSMFVVIVFASKLARFLSPDISGEDLKNVVFLMRLGSPIVIFQLLKATYAGYLQSDHKFTTGAKANVAYTIVFILVIIILRDKLDSLGFIIVALLASIVQLYIMLDRLADDGYKFSLDFNLDNDYLKFTFKFFLSISLVVLLGQLAGRVENLSISKISSTVSLADAGNIVSDISSIFIMPLVITIYPVLSRNYIEGETEELEKNSRFIISFLVFLILIISLVLIVFSNSIISAVYGGDGLSGGEITKLAKILRIYSLDFLFKVLYILVLRTYYAIWDLRRPILISLFYLVLNHLLNSLLLNSLGLSGIALASFLTNGILSILAMVDLRKKIAL